MYRVMLVDDETTITEGLKLTIDWDRYDCVVAASCKDGDEAVLRSSEIGPDIVITDIRMLNMDGLSMIEQLKPIRPGAKFIVLSGYSEFDFAQKAILLGIQAYLLKPVEEEELEEALRRCVESIEQDRRIQSQLDIAKNLQTNLRELVLFQLLDPDNENKEQLHRIAEDAELELQGPAFTVLLIQTEAQALPVRTRLAEYCWTSFRSYVVHYSKHQSAVLLNHPLPAGKEALTETARQLLQFLTELGFPGAKISIGSSYSDLTLLSRSFEEALSISGFQLLQANHAIVQYEDASPVNTAPLPRDLLIELDHAIHRLDREAAFRTVDDLIQHWSENAASLSTPALKSHMITIVLHSLQALRDEEWQHEEWFSRGIIQLSEASTPRSAEECTQWLKKMILNMMELKSKTVTVQKRDVIDEAKAYIHKNFQSAITLASLSEQLYINPFYLSRLFKKRTGTSYLNYITQVRMDEAKRLLLTTDLKIYEVTEKVGYDTTKYFSKIFEKWVGCKPSEYRSRQGKDH